MLYAPPGYIPDPEFDDSKGLSASRIDAGFTRAARLLSGKWNLAILGILQHGPRRFAELHSALTGISPNILISKLRDLGASGVIERRHIPSPANCWVYQLTETGQRLSPILDAMARWGDALPHSEARHDPIPEPRAN